MPFLKVMTGALGVYPSSSLGSSGPKVATRATCAGISVLRMRVRTPSCAMTGTSKKALPVQWSPWGSVLMMYRSCPRLAISAFNFSASLGLCGLSIMTMPSDVVTNPWLQPRIWVSAKTLLVSCCIVSLLFWDGDASSVRVPWCRVNTYMVARLSVHESAIHFLGRDRKILDTDADRIGHSVGDGRCYRPNRVLPNALGVVGSRAALRC